ncbi:MAG: prephenate dehydrogenase/arogenate dehydrogenase family protein, partial [Candidatus Binataceae bacterium]
MPVLFRQLTIAGVGLIGGSLALIARKHGLVERITGLGRSQANLDIALERGLIDAATRDPAEAAHGADLLMLATPVLTFPSTLAAMTPYLPANCVVTDVGSVKGWVIRELEPLLERGMALVGVHPVAGKEITGAIAADEGLYAGR